MWLWALWYNLECMMSRRVIVYRWCSMINLNYPASDWAASAFARVDKEMLMPKPTAVVRLTFSFRRFVSFVLIVHRTYRLICRLLTTSTACGWFRQILQLDFLRGGIAKIVNHLILTSGVWSGKTLLKVLPNHNSSSVRVVECCVYILDGRRPHLVAGWL